MSKRHPDRVLKFMEDYPFAMLPSALETLIEVITMRIEGHEITEEEIRARVGTPPPPRTAQAVGAVGVIPIFGVLAHRMNLMTQMSGGTSTEQLAMGFQMAVADPAITAIVLDVDSPGGSVFGIQELADVIYQGRGSKPIIASVNATAASAAYWLASQADEIVVTPSGQVGSIGAMAIHMDHSKQAEMIGVKPTFVTAGKYKAAGNDLQPLDDATRADMQRRVDQYYNAFTKDVARGRGVPVGKVRGGYGEGRMVSATDAVKLGMADGIGTLDRVLARLATGAKSGIGAALETVPVAAEVVIEPLHLKQAAALRDALAARGA